MDPNLLGCPLTLCSLNQILEIVYSEVPKLPTSWFILLTSLMFILFDVHASGCDILSKEKNLRTYVVQKWLSNALCVLLSVCANLHSL